MCLKFRVKRTEHLLDIIREVESEIESFHAMLDASVIVHQLGDVRISEGDQFLLYLRNLPSKVQEFLQLHQNAVTVQQLKTGVQDYYIRTRVQGDLGISACCTACGEARCQGQDVLQLWKEGPFGRELSRTQEVQPLWQEGSFSKRLLGESILIRSQRLNQKPKASLPSLVEEAKVGEKVEERQKEEEEETSFEMLKVEQDEDYEDEGEPEGDDVEHPEPEGEDPSGSVNQINQMTMCVRGKPVTVAASSSSTERVCSEQHRVDEINLAEKFQSIGVGDPKRRWLVDSGATCHIISERWLSHYKVVYKYEVGIPVLKGSR